MLVLLVGCGLFASPLERLARGLEQAEAERKATTGWTFYTPEGRPRDPSVRMEVGMACLSMAASCGASDPWLEGCEAALGDLDEASFTGLDTCLQRADTCKKVVACLRK